MSKKLIKKTDSSMVEYEAQRTLPMKLKESITSALANITEEKALNLISQSLEGDAIRKKAEAIINKETIYVAKIPRKLDGAFDAGLLDFMTDSKTGENLGILVNGKNRIQGHVNIEQMSKSVDMASNIATLAVQQQMAQMTEVINDVRERVIALQEGHDQDLFGSIIGMHQQMAQMSDAKNEEVRKGLAINAITELNKVRGQLQSTIIKALKDMPILPQGDIKIAWEIAKDKTYLERATEAYDRIEELVSYYLAATQLLGYAYAFLGEESSYEDVFCPCPELLDDELLNKLVNAEAIYVEDIEDAWYKNPEQYMLQIKDASQRLFSHKENDVIELEISGQKLLEAL